MSRSASTTPSSIAFRPQTKKQASGSASSAARSAARSRIASCTWRRGWPATRLKASSMSMKSRGRFCSGPKYGSSSGVRAPKNSISRPLSNLPLARRRRRHSVIARIGAEPVPVQIMTMCDFGWLGIRKLAPKGPITCTLSPTCRSHM